MASYPVGAKKSRRFRGGWAPITPLPAVLLLSLLLPGGSVRAQEQRTVGFHIGQLQSQQKWEYLLETATSNGLSFGVNVDVPTPAEFLSIRVGLGYAQRGSQVWDPSEDPEKEEIAQVRSHYLSSTFEGKLRARFGPTAGYVFLGPAIDLLLETQCSEDLCAVLVDERPAVLSAVAGLGVSVYYQNRFRGDFEVRWTESLSDAYRGLSSGVGYRSVEFLFRASFPF
jgi:hypothetical protein